MRVHRQRDSGGRVVRIDRGVNRIDACIDIAGYCGESGTEFGSRRIALAIVAQCDPEQMMRRSESGLRVQDLSIRLTRGAAIALAMRDHRALPESVHFSRIERGRAYLFDGIATLPDAALALLHDPREPGGYRCGLARDPRRPLDVLFLVRQLQLRSGR